jgi:hypothetical protein
MRVLWAAGADINARASTRLKGFTSLHCAAFKGKAAAIQLLLSAGVSVGAVDNFGQTALHVAALRGHTKVVQQLLMAGVPVDALTHEGASALDLAVLRWNLDMVRVFLAHQQQPAQIAIHNALYLALRDSQHELSTLLQLHLFKADGQMGLDPAAALREVHTRLQDGGDVIDRTQVSLSLLQGWAGDTAAATAAAAGVVRQQKSAAVVGIAALQLLLIKESECKAVFVAGSVYKPTQPLRGVVRWRGARCLFLLGLSGWLLRALRANANPA